MKFLATLCACLLLGSYAASAKDGDIDEYTIRQQIRKKHPDYSLERETEVFLLHKLSPDLFKYDTNFDGKISADELSNAVSAAKENPDFKMQAHDYALGRRKIPVSPPDKKEPPKTMPGEPDNKAVFLLRRKFDQISSLAFPQESDDDAAGALFSYGRDNAASNTVWAAQGVAAIIFGKSYSSIAESQRFSTRISYAAGPFVQFDKLSNSSSSQQKSNLDNLTLGAIGEVGVVTTFANAPVTDYFRLKGGVTTDFEGVTKSWNIAGEWQPVSHSLGLNSPLQRFYPLNLSVTPIFKARVLYASMLGSTLQPIFAHHDEALRVGPTVGVVLAPVLLGGVWPKKLQNMSLTATYAVLQDLTSPATYNLFDVSFTYFSDDTKTLGITLTYERGQVEQTGAISDTFMAGLSLKLYQDLAPAK